MKLRAERLGGAERVEILAETELETVLRDARGRAARRLRDRLRPDALLAELGSAPGSVAQVREAAAALAARREGARASRRSSSATSRRTARSPGPRVLEHLVDCVLQFEGDRYHAHRILRARKNRFGSTNELGVFEMTGAGLVGCPIRRSSSAARGRRRSGSAVACALEGTRPSCSRDPGARRADAISRCRRRVATGVDPKRLAMIVAVLARHAGCPRHRGRLRQRRRRRADRRAGADLAIASRSPRRRRAPPTREGLAAFGEIGLTGPAAAAAQADAQARGVREARHSRP